MKIIGIGGTNGSGKDTLSQLLADDYGWLFVSVSQDLIIPELRERGLPLERKNMAALTAEWNRDIDEGAVIDKAVEKFRQKGIEKFTGLVISSIRHPWEADRIHELGGKVVWLDADPKLRYERIFSRGQGEKDRKSFEQFLAEEESEKHHSGDKATLNWQGVKNRSDIFITNDGNDIQEFRRNARQALNL